MFLKKIFLTLISLGFSYSAQAASLAVLPVLSERIEPRLIQTGPRLFRNQEENNWELAKLLRTALSIGGFRSLDSVESIRRAYKKLGLNSKRKPKAHELRELGREIDTEKLLISRLQRKSGLYILTTTMFYTSSGNFADTVQTSFSDIWHLLDLHLRERFPAYKKNIPIGREEAQTLLFLLDTSGSNYKEVKALTKLLKQHEKTNIGICALSGEGTLSFLRPGINKESTVRFLSGISARGGGNHLKNFFKALNCIQKIFPALNTSRKTKKKVRVILLVSSAPKSGQDRRRTKLILNRFSKKAEILLVGSSGLKPPERSFWQEVIHEIPSGRKRLYKDLLYRQVLGLANGREVSILKKGDQLLENNSKDIATKPDRIIDIPPRQRSYGKPERIKSLYSKLSGNRVISSGKVEILMAETIFDQYLQRNSVPDDSPIQEYIREKKYVKLLIEMEASKFWIYLPKKTIYTKQGRIRINTGERYYFLLNMKPGSKGTPFVNQPHFGMIYENLSHLPRSLLLSLSEYLKDENRYLGRSLGGSSLYIFFAKVRLIKFDD